VRPETQQPERLVDRRGRLGSLSALHRCRSGSEARLGRWSRVTSVHVRLLQASRKLIVMDVRGTGCSERGTPSDVLAAGDDDGGRDRGPRRCRSRASGCFCRYHLGLVACMFAATFPERTAALTLTAAAGSVGCRGSRVRRLVASLRAAFGGARVDGRHIRKYIHADVRAILPSIHVQTLVFCRADAQTSGYAEPERFLAERITAGRFEELPGSRPVTVGR
jgi:pimeloyl-ACP methyl ester carboxylesterase